MKALDAYRDALVVGPAIKHLPRPAPLIDGWLDLDSLTALYGPPGGHKTFIALDWAMHITTDMPWNGAYVEPGNVLYIVAEGAGGIGQRIEGWEQHHHREIPDRMIFLPAAPNLYRPGALAQRAVIDLAAELQPVLTVIDTQARCTVGADENSSRDMGIVIEHLDQIRRATGGTVLVLHHVGTPETV